MPGPHCHAQVFSGCRRPLFTALCVVAVGGAFFTALHVVAVGEPLFTELRVVAVGGPLFTAVSVVAVGRALFTAVRGFFLLQGFLSLWSRGPGVRGLQSLWRVGSVLPARGLGAGAQ